jgi:hypothetical protein
MGISSRCQDGVATLKTEGVSTATLPEAAYVLLQRLLDHLRVHEHL